MLPRVLILALWLSALCSPLSAAIAPTTYQPQLLSDATELAVQKMSIYNAALTEWEAAEQNAVDARNAANSALTRLQLAREGAQHELLNVSTVASAIYNEHVDEVVPEEPQPEPAPPEDDPAPADDEGAGGVHRSRLRVSKEL